MIKHSENYNINKFMYNKDDRKFVSGASDLGIKAGMPWPYMFFIENAETKNRVLFTYANTVRDDEGDMMYVTYVSNSVIGTFTAKIFND